MSALFEYIQQLFYRITEYLFSFAENNVTHLVIITVFLISMFFLSLILRRSGIRKARKKIPLVIGGWGTRGKSGTERKKAALLHALGYNVVSKVTGSEAMFIHGAPGVNPQDIFIYRPDDKSSIWEQQKLIKWGARLGAEVFLWECMALRPDYVNTLQNDWMKDDLSTLTNAAPDHENVQGPAGYNIPEVMVNFFPQQRVIFTAEEQMVPILRAGAESKGSILKQTPWWYAELLTDDVLSRYPYHVHPQNMALILLMAEELGIEPDFVLKEVAEYIVPDIGALRTFHVEYATRYLEFVNGMAANDRMSTLSNWNRVGYDRHNADQEPALWIVTVVNNRGDRIPRSKEFARMMAMDLMAHKHICIGTNLKGLQGYYQYALDQWLKVIVLIDDRLYDGQKTTNNDRYAIIYDRGIAELTRLKIEGRSRESQAAKITVMLSGLHVPEDSIHECVALMKSDGSHAEVIQTINRILRNWISTEVIVRQVCDHINHDRVILYEIEAFFSEVRDYCAHWESAQAQTQTLNKNWRKLLKKLMLEKILILEDPKLSGDQILDQLVRCTPPGFSVQIMGIQNIKCTGLDFAYRWLSLDYVQNLIAKLDSPVLQIRMDAIKALETHNNYGIIDAPLALEALQRACENPDNSSEELQQSLTAAIGTLQEICIKKQKALTSKSSSTFLNEIYAIIEQLVEYGDAKRRKRKARHIITDLFNGHISHTTAARLMHNLVKRQYGGWMGKGKLRP